MSECIMCGNTNTVDAQIRQEDGSYKSVILACMCGGTKDEIWENTKFLLEQFIFCFHTDKENGSKSCVGCEVEREEIMNHLWHYGNAS